MTKTPTLAEITAAATPMTCVVPICVKGDLHAEHQRLEVELQRVRTGEAGTRLGGKSQVPVIARKIEAVQKKMREATYEFVFRALSAKDWSDLVAAHPPQDPKKHLWNSETFPQAAIAKCCVSPDGMDDPAAVAAFFSILNPAQQTELFDGAWGVNTTAPKEMNSSAASVALRDFGTNSSSATNTESLEASSSVA